MKARDRGRDGEEDTGTEGDKGKKTGAEVVVWFIGRSLEGGGGVG